MTSISRKFTFDDFLDFERPPEPVQQAEIEAPPQLFSETELAQAHADGFEEGRAQALMDHERSDAHRFATALERIADGMAALGQAESARNHAFQSTSLNVAMMALRKVLPDLARRFGQSEIEALLAEILSEQLEEPRLVIRVPDIAFDPLSDQIGQLAAKRGYTGNAVLIVDDALGHADCRIEWADGGVERIADRTLSDITNAIVRLSQTSDAPATPPSNRIINPPGD